MLQIFVVFHKKIFDDCYSDVPQEILDKYFTFIAVNEKIPKEYDREKYNVINEWELPIYDPSFQERGYNENSALYHVYVNKLYEDYDYIGFCQYDMVFNSSSIDDIINNLQYDSYQSIKNISYIESESAIDRRSSELFLQKYEEFFGVQFSKIFTYPMNNTFIISTDFFAKILMPFTVTLYNDLWTYASAFQNNKRYIGEVFERVSGYTIGDRYRKHRKFFIYHDWPNLKNQL